MNCIYNCALIGFFLGALFSPKLYATTFANRPLKIVVTEAKFIIRGTTGNTYSERPEANKKSETGVQIFTYTELFVVEELKGKLPEKRILMRQPGGSADGMEMQIPGTARFEKGEDVVVLLGERNEDDGSYDVPGFATGKYNIQKNASGSLELINSLGSGAVYDGNKNSDTLSYNARMTLEEFRRFASGESGLDSETRQFAKSEKPALKGAYDAHGHSSGSRVEGESKSNVSTPTAEIERPKKPELNIHLVLVFVIFIFTGVAILWKLKSGKM